MPYKDKDVTAAERMRRYRDKGVTKQGVTDEGVTWETMPLKEIIAALPQDIVSYIESTRYGSTEIRFRRAYKYKVWHDANFINGIHKTSKYREYVRN